jgi:osmotically-inducible protein OsmY
MPGAHVGSQRSASDGEHDRSSQASGQGHVGREYDRSSQLGRSVPQSAGHTPIPGPYIGRGPRGYQRSDERIREDVCERLTEHGQLDASDIEVKVENAEVTLVGTVNNRQAKRMADDTVESIPWVKQVHNQLLVGMPSDSEKSPGRPGDAKTDKRSI